MFSITLTQRMISIVRRAIHYSVTLIERLRTVNLSRWAVLPLMFLYMLAQTQCTSVGNSHTRESMATTVSLPVAQETTSTEAQLIQRAQKDPLGLLEEGLKWLESNDIQDYEGLFTVQERIKGRLNKPTVCQFTFRTKPFALAMQVLEGAGRVDRLLYVEGQQMVVHPTGLAGRLVSAVCIDPEDSRVREGSLRPVSEFGLRKALERIIDTYQGAELRELPQSECSGFSTLNDSKVVTLSMVDTKTRIVIDLDVEKFIPLRIRQYTHDGQLLCSYQYDNLRFNCLDDSAFSREANGLSS